MGYVNWNKKECEDFARVAEQVKRYIYIPWAEEIHKVLINKKQSPVILDVGSGPGDLSILLADKLPLAEFILTDEAIGMEKIAQAKIKSYSQMSFTRCSATNLNVDNESIDVVICKHLLTHIDNSERIFPEIFRVLKHHGMVFIIDFNSSASLLKALLLFFLISIKMGIVRSRKFWIGYRKGIPSQKIRTILIDNGFKNITQLTRGVNYLTYGEKGVITMV